MAYTNSIHGRPRTTRELEYVLDRADWFSNDYLKPIIREWNRRQRPKS